MANDSAFRRFTRFLLVDSRALALITAAYIVVGFALLHYSYVLNDEGLTVHYLATWARFNLPAVFFFQKAKPVLSVLYALPSSGGVVGTMVAHVLVSALAVPFIGGVARSLGYRFPNLPALIIAFSPIFLLGGAAGIANNDAIVGVTLVLFLLGRRHSLAAGLVLGCLPWVRSEMLPLVPILLLHAIFIEPNRRFAIGATMFPVLYALLGATYHRDLLWMAHYPPSSPYNPSNPVWQGMSIGPRYFLGFLMAVTPVAGLVICVPFRRLRPLERTLLFYMLLMSVLLEVLPIFKIGNFGGSPRYLAQLLPVLALLAARVLETLWEGKRLPVSSGIAAVAYTVWSATRVPGQVYVVPMVAIFITIITLGCLRWGRAAILMTTLLVLGGPLLVPGTQLPRKDMASYLDPMAGWLQSHRDMIRDPIYTNSQPLEAFAQLSEGLPQMDVRFLIAFDHLEGTLDLSNPNNGQREAIRRLCEQSFYGHGVIARTLRPDDLPAGALFILRVENRLDIILPPEIWKERLEILHEERGARIARLRPAPTPIDP